MSEQICDICKKEPARVFIKGQGKYCLKCYNMMALNRSGTDDTYHYPDTVAVREADGKLHIFHIEHDDYFPLYNEEIRRIVDPYGDDEEMERLCDA